MLFIRLPLRLAQAVPEYLNDKPSRKATWTELMKYFENIFKMKTVSSDIILVTKPALNAMLTKEKQVDREKPLYFMWASARISIVEMGIDKRLKEVLFTRGWINLDIFEKDLLFDSPDFPSDEKLKITFELATDNTLSAVLEIVDKEELGIDIEPTEEDDWPADEQGNTFLDLSR